MPDPAAARDKDAAGLDKHTRQLLHAVTDRFREVAHSRTGLWLSPGEMNSHAAFLGRLCAALGVPTAPDGPDPSEGDPDA
jgi:hypothetical protein